MLFLVLIIAIVIVVIFLLRSQKEGFGNVIGAAAPYQELLVNCLNQCDEEDPSNRLLPQANITCDAYCDFIVSDMAKKGIPPEDFKLVNFSLNDCETRCASSNNDERMKCLGLCYSEHEVAKWCKEMQCPFSNFDEDDCMKMCVSSKNADNINMRWNWSKA